MPPARRPDEAGPAGVPPVGTRSDAAAGAPRSRRRRRTTLGTRVALLSVGVAVVTALVAGIIAADIVNDAGHRDAQRTLSRLADVARSVAVEHAPRTARQRLSKALQSLRVRFVVIRSDGTVAAMNGLGRQALTAADISRVLAGRSVSSTSTVDGTSVLVEARPDGYGGIALVQRSSDALADERETLRELLLALVVAAAVAAMVGLAVAARLSRPLRRTAAAAHAVASGARDVTLPHDGPAEIAEVSEAVAGIAEALRRSEARQREFLLSVSHDLRTPLTAITGYAESLADGVVPASETAHVGAVVLGEAHRLGRLVGDLLDLARLGADDFRVDFAVVDLVALAHSAAPVWSTRCAAAGVQFVLDVADGPVLAWTDPSRLRQALDGLFDNALRVTPANAPIVLAVRAAASAPAWAGHPDASAGPSPVLVEVRDGGPGLDDADLAVAFEQGALYDRYRGERPVGTGLGLAIVAALTARLHGHVEAGHAVEGGARFTIVLPADGSSRPL